MKKRKSSPSKRGGSPVRYGLEAAILCILLLAAAYVNNNGSPSPVTPPAQTISNSQKKSAPVGRSSTQEHGNVRAGTTAKTSGSPDGRQYRLVRVSDGDSFELKDDENRTLRVRLYGVDAPEGNQRFGRESREHLLDLLKNSPLCMKTMYKDNYQRTVAIVYLCDNDGIDERSVNQRQVQSGMAWVYDYFCKIDLCNTWKLEEAMARKQKLGLWQDEKPTPPWQWRKTHKR